MSYEVYRYIFLGALIASGVFFAIAVVLFFTLRIPKVISDLSGRTARKAIENIRLQNEQSGEKSYQTSPVNMERGKITDKISRSGRLISRDGISVSPGAFTEKIATQQLSSAGETDVLTVSEETSVLSAPAGETDVLAPPAGETDVLAPPAGETAVLGYTQQPVQMFVVEHEITFVHSGEVID